MRRLVWLFALVAPVALAAQTGSHRPLTADQQIALAVLPLPVELRASASVLGYGADGSMVPLRTGDGGMTCLAPNPSIQRFHVACYHSSLEAFMARGRALRKGGVTGPAVDSARYAEIAAGSLVMPTQPASLYSLTGDWTVVNTDSLTANGARSLFVIYIPFATGKTTGLSEKPTRGSPWLMNPGTPKAHIMFVPEM